MMGGGQLLSVDATHAAGRKLDGARAFNRAWRSGGAMAAGVVTSLTGTPPTQLVLVMHDGTGSGMMASNLAGTTTVNVGDATRVLDRRARRRPDEPAVHAAIRSCERERVASASRSFSAGQMMQGGGMHGMMGGGTLTATPIYLGQQGLRGTVSGYTQAGAQSTLHPHAARQTPPSRS